jgi:hypothetical protein
MVRVLLALAADLAYTRDRKVSPLLAQLCSQRIRESLPSKNPYFLWDIAFPYLLPDHLVPQRCITSRYRWMVLQR